MELTSKPFYPVFSICPTWKPINNNFSEIYFSTENEILKSQVN